MLILSHIHCHALHDSGEPKNATMTFAKKVKIFSVRLNDKLRVLTVAQRITACASLAMLIYKQ